MFSSFIKSSSSIVITKVELTTSSSATYCDETSQELKLEMTREWVSSNSVNLHASVGASPFLSQNSVNPATRPVPALLKSTGKLSLPPTLHFFILK